VSNRARACPETGEKPEPLNTCISDAIEYVRERLADDDDDNDDNVDDDDESAARDQVQVQVTENKKRLRRPIMLTWTTHLTSPLVSIAQALRLNNSAQ